MSAIKVVEIVGVSDRSWHDAVNNALVEASKTIRGITGIDVLHTTPRSMRTRSSSITQT
jgi:flavin-binding protein dodecin